MICCDHCANIQQGMPCEAFLYAFGCDACPVDEAARTVCCRCVDGSNFKFVGVKEDA